MTFLGEIRKMTEIEKKKKSIWNYLRGYIQNNEHFM